MIDRLWYRFNIWRHGNLWDRYWNREGREWVRKRLLRRVSYVTHRLETLDEKHDWWYGRDG